MTYLITLNILEFKMQVLLTKEPNFYLPTLESWVITIANFLLDNQFRVMIITATRSQRHFLRKIFYPKDIAIFFGEEPLPSPFPRVDFLLDLSSCPHRSLLMQERGVSYISKIPTVNTALELPLIYPPSTQVWYSRENYPLTDHYPRMMAIGRQVARLAHISPNNRILILLPGPNEVESMHSLLARVRLPIPVISNLEELKTQGSCIIIAQRDIAFFLTPQLNPTYTFDSMITRKWVPTLTQGRRLRDIFVSPQEANDTLQLGGIIHRIMTETIFLQLKETPDLNCVWRQWFVDPSVKQPSSVEKCWGYLESFPEKMEAFRDFLLAANLGLRPALVLWKWYQDNNKLEPMIYLIALIDSYDLNLFQYPPWQSEYRHDEYLILRRYHRNRYYSQFRGSNDLEVLLKIWHSLLSFAGSLDQIPGKVTAWSLQNAINPDKILEVYQVTRELLTYFQVETTGFPLDLEDFLEATRPYVESVYADRLLQPSQDGFYHQGGHSFSRSDQDYIFTPNPEGAIYGIVVHDTPNQCLVLVALPQQEVEETQVEIIA